MSRRPLGNAPADPNVKAAKAKKKGEVLRKWWRIFNVDVSIDQDPGKDDVGTHDALIKAVEAKLGVTEGALERRALKVVRKSFDARKERSGRGSSDGRPKFSYTVDVNMGG
jgi:hypothetical protein